jgi:Ribbon-helix-helix protein, copG family
MPRGDYPRELSKTDPLRVEHIKIPTSTMATLDSAAAKRQRSRSWLVREILGDWALEYRKSGPGAEYREDVSVKNGRRRQA